MAADDRATDTLAEWSRETIRDVGVDHLIDVLSKGVPIPQNPFIIYALHGETDPLRLRWQRSRLFFATASSGAS